MGLALICAPAVVIALLTLYTNAIDTSTTVLGHASFSLFGWSFGWYGIGGLIGLLSGPVAYVIFKSTPRRTARPGGGAARGGPAGRDGRAAAQRPPPARHVRASPAYSESNSTGLFSHDRVEKRQSALGGSSTPVCVAVLPGVPTPSGAGSL